MIDASSDSPTINQIKIQLPSRTRFLHLQTFASPCTIFLLIDYRYSSLDAQKPLKKKEQLEEIVSELRSALLHLNISCFSS
jgi:hypothetical protein